MKASTKINQDLIERKLLIDHEIHMLVSNILGENNNDGLTAIKYLRKEVKRIHKSLKKSNHTGQLVWYETSYRKKEDRCRYSADIQKGQTCRKVTTAKFS